jgi:hypothetical protein
MGITFLGHTPNFEMWVFNLDGNRFVARNFSTPNPLSIKFAGVFDDAPLAAPLIKTSSFDITESNSRIVIWTYLGKAYTSSWDLDDEDRDDDAATRDAILSFGPSIPYAGPPVAPVGTGGVTNTQSPPPAPIPPIVPSLPILTGPQLPTPSPVYQPDPVLVPRVPTPTPMPFPVVSGPTPVVSGPVPPAVTPSGTDWVKLGLQLGAAYLLLS